MKNRLLLENGSRLAMALCILWFALVSGSVHAQQDPVYAQYLNNPMIVNPAFAGINNMFNANLQYRTQWSGLDANPTTINFNSHMSVFRNMIGLGVMVIEDKLGENKNTEISTLYSYKINLKDGKSLSFGMQTGFTQYTNNPDQLAIFDPDDPAFVQFNETKFNTGVGVIYRNERLTMGVSVPRLIPVSISQGGQEIEVAQLNYYFMGSYLINISEDIRIKPSALLRGTQGSSLSADINATLIYKDVLGAGVFTRNFATHGFLVNALVEKFRLGYVFELPGSQTSGLNFATHEITIGISFGLLDGHDKYPKLYY